MKRWGLVMLAMVFVCVGALAETAYYGSMMVDHCSNWVSLREKPSTEARRLAKVPLHGVVTDAQWEEAYGDFIYCGWEDTFGYILSDYLEPWAEPEPAGASDWRGVTFELDSDVFKVDGSPAENGESLLIEPLQEMEEPVYLELLSPETVGGVAGAFLEDNRVQGVDIEEETTEAGDPLYWFLDVDGESTRGYFEVDGDQSFIAAYGVWPTDGTAKWGGAFLDLMRSVRFGSNAPMVVAWADEREGGLVIDPDGEWVELAADEDITDIELMALAFVSIGESGLPTFDETVLYDEEELSRGLALAVKIAFPGDTPTYGIRCVDANGDQRRYAIALSGEDGSLRLEAY